MEHTPLEFRRLVRAAKWQGSTAALCGGYVQANLVIVPQGLAGSFMDFCRQNPKPCPLLEVTEPGQFDRLTLASETDLRTDIPKYLVYRYGELEFETVDLLGLWREDLVSFLLGCSFTFDAALQRAGIAVRHIDEHKNVPMYVTNMDCVPAGPFAGPLVVSMRPIKAENVALVTAISGGMPLAHGAPVHTGDPAAIGIHDLARPDFGEAVTVAPDEVPVFWACGVTPQAVARQARPELMIAHSPGHMFVTDLTLEDLERWAERPEVQSNQSARELQ